MAAIISSKVWFVFIALKVVEVVGFPTTDLLVSVDCLLRDCMRVCKKMVIYLEIKTPQSSKERKYTCYTICLRFFAGMIASIRGKKPHEYRVIILKQTADHNKRQQIAKTIICIIIIIVYELIV